jgi:hypothetical protein
MHEVPCLCSKEYGELEQKLSCKTNNGVFYLFFPKSEAEQTLKPLNFID